MRLAELQLAFWQAVRTRGAPPSGLDAFISAPSARAAAERLSVYHHAYWERQVLALSSTFPRLRAHLGTAAFERLALRYIERWPSDDPCIERVGAQLVAFLADGPRLERDTARLEWASLCALLAPDRLALRAIPPELVERLAHCRVELHPSLHLEEVVSGAVEVFLDESDGNDGRGVLRVDDGAQRALETHLVFFRSGFAVRHVVLDADEARAMAFAALGASFTTICDSFSALSHEAAVARAASVLNGWLARGWITNVVPEGALDASR